MDLFLAVFKALSLTVCIVVSFPYGTAGSTTVRDYCNPQPCLHGGTCHNTMTGFKCHCTWPYTGEGCDIGNPTTTSFPSTAAAGSTTVRDYCNPQPCNNGGACQNKQSGFLCHCTWHYYGETCDIVNPTTTSFPSTAAAGSITVVDYCKSQPCHHGGTCRNDATGFKCHCTLPYTGETCSTGNPGNPVTTALPSSTTAGFRTTKGWLVTTFRPWSTTTRSSTPLMGHTPTPPRTATGPATSVQPAASSSTPSPLKLTATATSVVPSSHRFTDVPFSSTERQAKEDKRSEGCSSGCSVIVCYVIVPAACLLALASVALLIFLCIRYKERKERRDETKENQVSPRAKTMIKVKRYPVTRVPYNPRNAW